jgi:AraC family transcriptional regulator
LPDVPSSKNTMSIAQLTQHVARVATPIFLAEAQRELGLSAAGWHLTGTGIEREPISHHVLSWHPHAGATMTRVADGVPVRKALRQGCVSLVRASDRVRFAWDSPLDTVHVYIHPEALRRLADDHLIGDVPVQLNGFFCIDEPWLAGYFRMLASEHEGVVDGADATAVAQFLAESEALLLHHLIRCHSSATDVVAPRPGHASKLHPLRPTLMRRIEEHVSTHLSEVIHLAALAEMAHMSVDHFLRSFRAAAGTTPYQYILGLRLAKASALLRETAKPIAEIALECGFQSASHFSVAFSDRFGTRPSQYRRSA